jgi:hypothetical protein
MNSMKKGRDKVAKNREKKIGKPQWRLGKGLKKGNGS